MSKLKVSLFNKCVHFYKYNAYFEQLGREFPVCRLDDIKLYFNHAFTFDEAKSDWNRRRNRVHMDNIMVVSYTNNPSVAEMFDSLNYDKKIIFTSFETDIQSARYLNIGEWGYLANAVNSVAKGLHEDYSIFNMWN